MSPEQASELVPTPASDIYSLGATLFKILCGVPPATGSSLIEIKTKIVEGRLPSPTEIRSDVPTSLEAICDKAMAIQPSDRYPTALALAEDVECYLADEPVSGDGRAGDQQSRSVRPPASTGCAGRTAGPGRQFSARGVFGTLAGKLARSEYEARGRSPRHRNARRKSRVVKTFALRPCSLPSPSRRKLICDGGSSKPRQPPPVA